MLKYLNEKEKKVLFYSNNNQKIIEKNKINICEYIFMNSNYNRELYKYAVDKIFKEEKNQNDKDIKSNKLKNELNNTNKKCYIVKTSICSIILIIVSVGLQILYFKNIRKAGFIFINK